MKLILPLGFLFIAILGCTAPRNARIEQTRELKTDPAKIEYSKPRWSNEANVYHLLSFEVKNTSNHTLEFIQIEASFYDKNGEFLQSASPYIARYQGLPAGEKSTAQVQTSYDPRIKSASFRFSCHGDEPFSKVDIDATEVARVR